MNEFETPEAIRVWLRRNLRGAWSLPRARRILGEAGVPASQIDAHVAAIAGEKWRWTRAVVAAHFIAGAFFLIAAGGGVAIGNGVYLLKQGRGFRELMRVPPGSPGAGATR